MDKIRDIEVEEYDFEFVSTNPNIYDQSLLQTHEVFKKMNPPISCETNGHLIKMNTPCKYIREKFKVIFRDHGEFIVQEVIDESNFTIVIPSNLPKDVILETISTNNVKVIKKEYRDVLSIYAIKELDKDIRDTKNELNKEIRDTKNELNKEIRDTTSNIVTEIKYRTLNSRISMLENIIVSLCKRIETIEKV
jgi:hypothetical protein